MSQNPNCPPCDLSDYEVQVISSPCYEDNPLSDPIFIVVAVVACIAFLAAIVYVAFVLIKLIRDPKPANGPSSA